MLGGAGWFLPAKISLTNGLAWPIGLRSGNAALCGAPPVELSLAAAAAAAAALWFKIWLTNASLPRLDEFIAKGSILPLASAAAWGKAFDTTLVGVAFILLFTTEGLVPTAWAWLANASLYACIALAVLALAPPNNPSAAPTAASSIISGPLAKLYDTPPPKFLLRAISEATFSTNPSWKPSAPMPCKAPFSPVPAPRAAGTKFCKNLDVYGAACPAALDATPPRFVVEVTGILPNFERAFWFAFDTPLPIPVLSLFAVLAIPLTAGPTTGAFPRAVVTLPAAPVGRILAPLNILSVINPLVAPTIKSCCMDSSLTAFFVISNAICLLPVWS